MQGTKQLRLTSPAPGGVQVKVLWTNAGVDQLVSKFLFIKYAHRIPLIVECCLGMLMVINWASAGQQQTRQQTW